VDDDRAAKSWRRHSTFSIQNHCVAVSTSAMARVNTDFIAVGGNRHPSAADWDPQSGLLAFGADRNIAIWNPLVSKAPCSSQLLSLKISFLG
jgi:hypothetical protein